ncbi:MAG: aldo/keto reductase [Actinomycetota bacterium]|nr:aldo/keto reductase [Actinomycetota bacterium]MDP2287206.1 aldo/keto reductase [Actinomycetota bacterium]
MAKLADTELDVYPLCLGGNVFSWTADEATSFDILDAYAAAGGNFIDTADAYNGWLPGFEGGESETIIGNWMKARGNRDQMVIATKVGSLASRKGLSADNIALASEDSLRRLQTDHIDLYYSHQDDRETPQLETLGAYDVLVKAGKVRYLGASNFDSARLQEALDISEANGFAKYRVLQNEYNLMKRADYEDGVRQVVAKEGMAHAPYFGLASGFLTGKYRPGAERIDSPRARGASKMLDDRGIAVLAAMDAVAANHNVPLSAVALAWLLAQPTVAAPIASARNLEQLSELLPMATLDLSDAELAELTSASEV